MDYTKNIEEPIYNNQQVEEQQEEQIKPTKITVKVDSKKGEVKQEQPFVEVNKKKLLKHQLPGNHILNEKEESKLGVRSNRYGIYGDNGYGKVVEIQKNKMNPKQKI